MLNHLFCAIIECLLNNRLVFCCNKRNMFDHSLVVLPEMLQPTALRAESLTCSFSEHPSFIQKCFGPLAHFAYSTRALSFLKQKPSSSPSTSEVFLTGKGTLGFLSGLYHPSQISCSVLYPQSITKIDGSFYFRSSA